MLRIITPVEWDLIKKIRNKDKDSFEMIYHKNVEAFVNNDRIDDIDSFTLMVERDFDCQSIENEYLIPEFKTTIRIKTKGASNENN